MSVLETRGLRKAFGRVEVVRDLNLSVRKGEIYGFLGRNGAGKTTTIRMLMGILKPDGGHINLLGKRVRRVGRKEKQQIGYVSQEQHFYPWMSCRVLGQFTGGFYPDWDDAEYLRLLKVLDLPPDRKTSHLSGGMKMKLALALALAHRPGLLILDEPTAGLDPVARREFLEIIATQSRNEERTTFFSTHRIDEVDRVGDRVGILHEGIMRYEGDLDVLKRSVRRVEEPMLLKPPRIAGEPPPILEEEALPSGFELVADRSRDHRRIR
ncbi:MAG: ABC transporter ATP-binding protein, partial [Verrucomicrobiota bacterium]